MRYRYLFLAIGTLACTAGCEKRENLVVHKTTSAETSASVSARDMLSATQKLNSNAPIRSSREDVVSQLKTMPISGTAIGYFLDRNMIMEGQRPKEWALFNLDYMQVIQRTREGYLMQNNLPGDGPMADSEYAFLYSNVELTENYHFLDHMHWAISHGSYKYQATNGFDREIPAFYMLPDWGNVVVNARLGRK